MKMLELFCGTKSMSNVFKEAGFEVFTVDNNPDHNPDLCIDVMELEPSMIPFVPDVIHASPPCTCFSVASIGHHWNKDKTPKTEDCKNALLLVEKTVDFIIKMNPKYFFIENPMGMMRKLPVMEKLTSDFFHDVVTYCQ